jgi:hypothetical protein
MQLGLQACLLKRGSARWHRADLASLMSGAVFHDLKARYLADMRRVAPAAASLTDSCQATLFSLASFI